MKRLFRTIPLFVALIPLFFVLHGYRENLGYIHPGEAILLAAVYLLGSALIFASCLVLFRDVSKAALAAGAVLMFYFFFGALQDFLKAHVHTLSRYSFVVPAILVATISWIVFLKRTKRSFPRLIFYLNCLFMIYILVDGVLTVSAQKRASGYEGAHASRDTIRFSTFDGPKRDIYFLIFDAYASSKCLREQYHYDNGDFDRFLANKGFHIQTASRANYKYTILSIPSILNMCYLDRLKDVKGGPVAEYYYLSDCIKDNELGSWLQSTGYDIVNCSIFDLRGHPSPITESLLPLQTRLITDQTFYSRFYRDVGWNFFRYTVNPLSDKEINLTLNNDNKLIALLESASAMPSAQPRFFYGHFNIPHPPYYYDKENRRRKVAAPYKPTDEDHVQDYLDYLNYTNKRAEGLIDTIFANTHGQAVIIVMGDHGLRHGDKLGYNPPFFLENQNAVYFPGKDYHLLYDSISGVNQFRVILNSVMGQRLPLLKDSIVNVKDKK
ncbi:MAG TPA: sulfatase-like hydrolase/transferase [Puia sp.]|nr:sulfatase-like hydrolase/transferase [Puia sp.]